MKCKVVLFVMLFPMLASAQSREHIDSLANSTLAGLISTYTLGISDTADLDIETYNRFKKLFDSSDASIQNDLNVIYEYKRYKKGGTYKAGGQRLPFDIYAHDLALAVQVKSITSDRGQKIDSAVADPAKRFFRLRRNVEFQKLGRYVVPDGFAGTVIGSRIAEPENDSSKQAAQLTAGIKKSEDSVYRFTAKETWIIAMTYDTLSDAVFIKEIKTAGSEITCLNDDDADGIPNNQDSLRTAPGDFTAAGRPDYDLDGIPDATDECQGVFGAASNKGCPVDYFYTKNAFDVFAGWQFNTVNINLPGLDQLGYKGDNATDVLQSQRGVLLNPGQLSSMYGGGNFIHYFGTRKKKAGLSVGITYTGFTGDYTMDTGSSVRPIMYTYKADDGTNKYRRQVKFEGLNESIRYHVFNLPLMFNYRLHPGRKNNSVIKVQAGPSLMFFTNKTTYNTTIDIGGIYQIDSMLNTVIYLNPFIPNSTYNVYMTADSINSQSETPGADSVFARLEKLGQYGFVNNRNYTGTQSLQRLALAFNIGIDLQQKISEGLILKLGAGFAYAPLPKRQNGYTPFAAEGIPRDNTYQSIYKSPAKSNYTTYGLNIGIVYNW